MVSDLDGTTEAPRALLSRCSSFILSNLLSGAIVHNDATHHSQILAEKRRALNVEAGKETETAQIAGMARAKEACAGLLSVHCCIHNSHLVTLLS
jgi:hypothetical protein